MKLRKCKHCDEYTLEELHCGERTGAGHPPKFDQHDKYGKYRRMERWQR